MIPGIGLFSELICVRITFSQNPLWVIKSLFRGNSDDGNIVRKVEPLFVKVQRLGSSVRPRGRRRNTVTPCGFSVVGPTGGSWGSRHGNKATLTYSTADLV